MPMSTLNMQTANQERNGGSAHTPRALEFRQAMKDFQTMFPALDSALIECVLRSNAGHVDSTIDQLLRLSQNNDRPSKPKSIQQRRWQMGNGKRLQMADYSSDSDDFNSSEMLDLPTSSNKDISIREPPPMYTPHADDLTGNFFNASVREKPADAKFWKKTYKAWNPPMLGTLPEDFLRILPQQFVSPTPLPRERSKSQKKTSQRKSNPPTGSQQQENLGLLLPASTVARPTTTGPSVTALPRRSSPPHSLTGPMIDDGSSNNMCDDIDNLTPPPRPPRTMLPQYDARERNFRSRSDHIREGNLFIQPATENQVHNHHRRNSSEAASRRYHLHHHNSRSTPSNRWHSSRDSDHQQNHSSASGNGNRARRNSDFSSRRMVMVPRFTEPVPPVFQNGGTISENGNDFPSDQHQSSSSFHRHQSPVFHRSDASSFASHSRPDRSTAGSSSGRSRARTQREEEQYVEDYRLAILLQNEEFIRELKRNDEFLQALENDRPTAALSGDALTDTRSLDEVVPLRDPDGKYPHGSRNSSSSSVKEEVADIEKDDGAFKEKLRHMGKSAKKKFNEIAKRFSIRRKSSYKSMKNIDPVFANCDDNFDEAPGPRSPTFDL